ncbi:MAG TPA: bifunctional riboflavin kinase/FAD synthetase [Verrucomicrobiae bacterium]|nr:bifunctional riboflavin kinase/FAD synthetase [Verrucomicrobiae bacterium]
MNIVRNSTEFKSNGKRVCLAIGFFDGIHLGHQQIIRQTIADARQHGGIALVLTFDKHPNAVVAPEKTPPLIYSLSQKLRAIQSLGIEDILLIAFDKPFSRQSGEEFVRALARDFGKIHSICVGADFVFGHKRSGNVALLKELGAELHFYVHGLSAVSLDGQPVSSTRIREAVRTGNLDEASQMLGRPYAICGKVMVGDKVGRGLGFPTANLDVTGLVLPPNGVYTAITRHNGRLYRVALNIGFRPTVAEAPQLRVEAHLLNFDGDLYDRELEIEIGEKLRDEKRFSSPQKLKEQISRDVAAIREHS